MYQLGYKHEYNQDVGKSRQIGTFYSPGYCMHNVVFGSTVSIVRSQLPTAPPQDPISLPPLPYHGKSIRQ